jgi:hypothetical protein
VIVVTNIFFDAILLGLISLLISFLFEAWKFDHDPCKCIQWKSGDKDENGRPIPPPARMFREGFGQICTMCNKKLK